MSLTGYISSSGLDLSYIFQSGNSGIVTGYQLINGQDIGSIFASWPDLAEDTASWVKENYPHIIIIYGTSTLVYII